MSEDPPSRAVVNRVKRIAPGARVSGKFGDFIVSTDGKRRKRARVFGHVIEAAAANKYRVLFDNNITLECFSNSLRVESASSSVPPDVPPPPPQDHSDNPFEQQRAEAAREQFEADCQEQEEEEHLPSSSPEAEDEAGEENAAEEEQGGSQENPDPEGLMPGQLPGATEAVQPDYQSRKRAAIIKIKELVGKDVIIKSGRDQICWTVESEHDPPPEDCLSHTQPGMPLGLTDFIVSEYRQDEVLCCLFLHLSFKDWKTKVLLLNEAIKHSKAKVKAFTAQEFLIGLGLLIGSAEFAQQGKDLFVSRDQKKCGGGDIEIWSSLIPHPSFDCHMSYSRFKDFRRFLPEIWYDFQLKDEGDPWWMFAGAVSEFNDIRRERVRASSWKVIDELMSAWRPRTTALGGLPNISFILRKPEPLGEGLLSSCFLL